MRPKLRRLERARLRRDDEQLLVLRDPLELCEPFAIDAIYEPVLDALDGQRTLAQVRQSLLLRGIVAVELDDLEDFVAELGEAGLLDDDRFRELWASAHDEFVEQEIREPRRAGLLYPADPESLRAWLAPALPLVRASGPASGAAEQAPRYSPSPIAIVTPHQPPPSCAASLRRLLGTLPEPEQYERVVILATDHGPGLLPFAACDKDMGTPLGELAADLATLATLDDRLPWLLREQVRLRSCDPLEWTVLLLRALWGDRCPPIVALACGQTRLTTQDGLAHARELVGTLRELLLEPTRAGKVLWWAAAELSHRGPAYGHAELPDAARVERDDRAMLQPLLDNQVEALASALMERPPEQRPSGGAALVTLAELLPENYRATLIDYALLPTPGDAPGFVGAPFVRVALG
ncbi:MAG TPA: AmmeMemoRadiSam system protein B [Enhygromyxa sp.]|nr:AmmeMemoRadiSam system protein B [Enhygromyxa sp.]